MGAFFGGKSQVVQSRFFFYQGEVFLLKFFEDQVYQYAKNAFSRTLLHLVLKILKKTLH